MDIQRLPVFSVVLDGGKTCRIIDTETRSPARDARDSIVDGGGKAFNALLAAAHAARINWERGLREPRDLAMAMTIAMPRMYREKIPSEHRTRIMSKAMAVKHLWKGNQKSGLVWLNKCIEDGDYRCIKLSRQRYVFDMRQFPSETHWAIKPT